MDPIIQGQKDQLKYFVLENRQAMGRFSAKIAIKKIQSVLEVKDELRIIFASAPSQNEFLDYLTKSKKIDWSRIIGFHMDEYIGLPEDSDQWFKNYLEEHLVSKVAFKKFHFIDGTKDPDEMGDIYYQLLTEDPIDIVCLGVGENGHIAFNDPPVADFNDPKIIKKVELDQYSRQQQVNDGCFTNINEVPTHALSLTIPALISASTIICTVPGSTKQNAVKKVLHDEISTACPATILRKHHDSYLVLDQEAYGGK